MQSGRPDLLPSTTLPASNAAEGAVSSSSLGNPGVAPTSEPVTHPQDTIKSVVGGLNNTLNQDQENSTPKG